MRSLMLVFVARFSTSFPRAGRPRASSRIARSPLRRPNDTKISPIAGNTRTNSVQSGNTPERMPRIRDTSGVPRGYSTVTAAPSVRVREPKEAPRRSSPSGPVNEYVHRKTGSPSLVSLPPSLAPVASQASTVPGANSSSPRKRSESKSHSGRKIRANTSPKPRKNQPNWLLNPPMSSLSRSERGTPRGGCASAMECSGADIGR